MAILKKRISPSLVLIVLAVAGIALSAWQVRAADKDPSVVDQSTRIPLGAVGAIVAAALFLGQRVKTWEDAMKSAVQSTQKIVAIEQEIGKLKTAIESRPCLLTTTHCPTSDLTGRPPTS